MTKHNLSLDERFWMKVNCDSIDQCWEWLGSKNIRSGYGEILVNSNKIHAHRIAYMLEVAPIPKGKEIHHKCENRACVNPWHLQAVSRREHIINLSPNHLAYKYALRTHCNNGHEFTPENTMMRTDGIGRRCRVCHSETRRLFRERNKR